MANLFDVQEADTILSAATGGMIYVVRDSAKMPNFFYRIPKFHMRTFSDDFDMMHPAFVTENGEIPEFYVGQFIASSEFDRAQSLPNKAPATDLTIEEARQLCKNKGDGFHLMNVWEYSAMSLWLAHLEADNIEGNTNYGRSHLNDKEGVRVDRRSATDPIGEAVTFTGTGARQWRTGHHVGGITDLVGNVWEMLDGAFVENGEMFLSQYNPIYQTKPEDFLNPDIYMKEALIPPADGVPFTDVNWDSQEEEIKHKVAGLEVDARLPSKNWDGYVYHSLSETKQFIAKGGDFSTGDESGLGAIRCFAEESKSKRFGFRLAYIKPQ